MPKAKPLFIIADSRRFLNLLWTVLNAIQTWVATVFQQLTVHFEMFIREPLFTTLNSPIFPRQGHYDKVLKDFEKFQTMIKLIN